jgi:hypothetical protein
MRSAILALLIALGIGTAFLWNASDAISGNYDCAIDESTQTPL